jgi:Domain of unknown function (DUF4349)
MTVNEIVDQLRATPPTASDALRLNVLTLASAPPAPAPPTLLNRVRARRRLALAVPAAVTFAAVSAVAIGVSRSEPVARETVSPPSAVESSTGSPDRTTLAGPASDTSAATAQKAAPGPVSGRAQRYSATLTIGVEDTDALSEATQRALAIARDLGGYLVSVQYATGQDGAASVTLKVPSGRASDAVTRLSALGTILGQSVQIQDLQESLDGLDRELERLRAQIAALTVAIERAETAAERARLLERRAQAQAQLRELRASRAATAAEARTATIQLELRTEEGSGVAAPGSRLDRALDKALEVLAWEALALLVLAVAFAPLALAAAAVWAGRRAARRRHEERLLGAS